VALRDKQLGKGEKRNTVLAKRLKKERRKRGI